MLQYIHRTIKRVSSPIFVSALVAVPRFAGHILLLRFYPDRDAGLVTVAIAIAALLLLVGDAGQSEVILRAYSRVPAGTFNWTRDLRLNAQITLPIVIVISISAGIYTSSTVYIPLFIILGLLQSINYQITMILTANRYHTWSNVLRRLAVSSYLIAAILALCYPQLAHFTVFIVCWLIGSILTLTLALFFTYRFIPNGKQVLSANDRRMGTSLTLYTGSFYLPEQIMVTLVAPLLDAAVFAAFSGQYALARVFGILLLILKPLLTTELVRDQQTDLNQPLLLGLALTVIMTVGAALTFPYFSQILYSGRYNDYQWLLYILIFMATLPFLQLLPDAYLLGRALSANLSRYIHIKTIGVVVIMVVGISQLNRYPLMVALATIIAQSLFQVGMAYVFSYRDQIHQQSN